MHEVIFPDNPQYEFMVYQCILINIYLRDFEVELLSSASKRTAKNSYLKPLKKDYTLYCVECIL